MQYREFGKTGVKISALGFGGMRLPTKNVDGKNVYDHETGVEVIQRAFELGVNYIDSAPYYCNNESEVIIGKALKGWRDKIYLSTKNPIEDDSGDHFRDRLETSLKKLDTDYIDFYHIWGLSKKRYINDVNVKNGPLQAMLKAKEEGIIKHMSFSFHDEPENLFWLIDSGYFETVLCQYNLLDRSNEKAISYAKDKGMGVVIMGPVGGGRLGYPSEAIRNLLPGNVRSNPETALRYVLANADVSCALSGMEDIKMVEENVAVASNEKLLSETEMESIEVSLQENKKLSELYCTGCKYCMPCPNEVNIPLNFELMNYHRVYNLTEYARKQYANIGNDEDLVGKKAEDCIECGICEAKCPQKIEIIKQLKETVKVLK